MALSRPFKEDVERFLFPRLSPPGDRWCDVLGFVPAGSVSQINASDFPRRKPLAGGNKHRLSSAGHRADS